jgi:plasmid stabilization system protein ParE
MNRVAVSGDALKDLHDGFWFYEAQEAGLGDYFASSLRADIEGLKVTGGMHRQVYRDYRRLLGRVFPYAIFYTVEDDVATVWAVIDCRRDPDWIRRHLDA